MPMVAGVSMRVLILTTMFTLLCACGGPSAGPEDQLRQWVADAEQYAQEKDRRALMAMISEAYVDARGNDFEGIDKMFRLYFLRVRTISLASTIDEIVVSADSAAEVLLTVGMLGTNDGTFGFDADAYRFHLELERDGNDWLLIGARYGALGSEIR